MAVDGLAPAFHIARKSTTPDVLRARSCEAIRRPKEGTPRRPTIFSDKFRRRDESPRQVLAASFLVGAAFRQAMWAALLFCCVYSALNTRDGILERPHPMVWRLLHGLNVWYCLLLVIFFVVPVADGETLMQWIFPDVPRQKQLAPDEVSLFTLAGWQATLNRWSSAAAGDFGYAQGASVIGNDHLDCHISVASVKRQIFGIWFIAHCIGWWAKMLMLRDIAVCITYSTFFEFTELTLQFLVPEFQECWWDSIILDWLLANLCVGMLLGHITLRLLNHTIGHVRWFDWAPGGATKILELVTPASWSEYKWNPANDPITMVLNTIIWLVMMLGEVNSFFFINILSLPRDHPFNVVRQVLMCLTAVPAVEEWYEYTRHARAEYTTQYTFGQEWLEYRKLYEGRKPRIGHFAWLMTLTVVMETAAIVRYGIQLKKVQFRYPGVETWGPWAVSASMFLLYFLIHCWLFYRRERKFPVWLRVLKWLSFLPLLALCRLYAF
eukprot:TRINITY_DN39726_c0_g1_i2.p1 TRINITY_DN39726_c0_g1~~TRINITY_DN39726_c0_g1_i2.p1  ORF type:complete len:495 (+),score=57.65 TRINITY_DN39726_c0_g1_i2:89-1573(+)